MITHQEYLLSIPTHHRPIQIIINITVSFFTCLSRIVGMVDFDDYYSEDCWYRWLCGELYFRKLQPLPVHVSRKWESFSLNFDLLMWAISLFPQQLAICVIINKGSWPLTSYLPSLNNNFSKIGHVNHTLNCGPNSFLELH